jgi:hypothetical protein
MPLQPLPSLQTLQACPFVTKYDVQLSPIYDSIETLPNETAVSYLYFTESVNAVG